MADSPLTALPQATTPLANTDMLYVVQDGVSKKVPAETFNPSGSSGQLQFNLNGAFAADSGLSYDRIGGALNVGGAVAVASAPVVNAAQTWNNAGVAFTALKLNITDTASAAGSRLMDLQVGGSSKFSIEKSGSVYIPDNQGYYGQSAKTTGIQVASGGGNPQVVVRVNGQPQIVAQTNWVTIAAATLQFSTAADLYFFREGAGVFSQRNGVNAQTFRLYNTYTDASNYERGFMRWNSNVLEIGAEAAGTGTARSLSLQQVSGRSRFTIDTSGNGDARNTLTLRTVSGYDPELYSTFQMYFTTGPGGFFFNSALKACQHNNPNNQTIITFDRFLTSYYQGDYVIQGHTRGFDEPIRTLVVTGGNPPAGATTNISGGNLQLKGGIGASSSSGAANGGAVYLDGGQGYGTGVDGNVIIGNTRGNLQMADARNVVLATATGTKIGTATDQKLAFWNATPVVQQVLATGTSKTVDDVIALLQTLGLCKQA